MTLESQMLDDFRTNGKFSDVERTLLIISGLNTKEEIAEYKSKLDKIDKQFQDYKKWFDNVSLEQHKIRRYQQIEDYIDSLVERHIIRPNHKCDVTSSFEENNAANFSDYSSWDEKTKLAFLLHDFLWNSKLFLSVSDNFLLKDVIDAQLSGDANYGIGDCVGLTSLYTLLGLRHNINLSTAQPSRGHIISSVNNQSKNQIIYIDNTEKYGFNRLMDSKVFDLGLTGLIAGVYNSRAILQVKNKNYDSALDDCTKAIEIKPDFANPYRQRGNIREILNDDTKGVESDHKKCRELEKI